jgi:porphobilinogen synthase
MLRETILSPQDFIYPLFVRHGVNHQGEILSMPGQYQWSVDLLSKQAEEIARLGIPAVILFGIPKDPIVKKSSNTSRLPFLICYN